MPFKYSATLYIAFSILCGVSGNTKFRKFTKIADKRCTNVTKTLTVSSQIACCRECMKNAGCTAVNYMSGRCELSNIAGVVATPGWNCWRTGAAACLPGWTKVGNSTCLYLDDTPRTWADAQSHCADLKASSHLVDVHNEAKWTMIETWLQADPLWAIDLGVWLGGKGHYNMYIWTDEQPLTWTHWYSGEPDGLGMEQCIGALGQTAMYWRTELCSYPIFYGVCEYALV